MPLEQKAMLASQFRLKSLDARIADFHNLAATQAEQVIMMRFWPGDFVTGDIVAKLDFGSKPGGAKQFESAINGGLAYGRVKRAYVLVKLFDGMMARKTEKSMGDRSALRCVAQSISGHEIYKIAY